MKTRSALLVIFLLLTQVQAMAASPLPKDVAEFVERREGCDHFRGEVDGSNDPHRRDQINRELKKLCTGTDKQLLHLKRKYAANAEVSALLFEFDADIEPSSPPKRH